MENWREEFIELYVPCSYTGCRGHMSLEYSPERGWKGHINLACHLCGRVGENVTTCRTAVKIYESLRNAGETHKQAEKRIAHDLFKRPLSDEEKPDEGAVVVVTEKESLRFVRMDPKCDSCGNYTIGDDGVCTECEALFTNPQ